MKNKTEIAKQYSGSLGNELYFLRSEDGNSHILLIPINERENPKLLDSEDIERIKSALNCLSILPEELLEEVVMNGQSYNWQEVSRTYASSFIKGRCLAKLIIK